MEQIASKEDYYEFLREDKKMLNANTRHPILSDNIMILLTDPCYKFQILLRTLEYYTNCKKGFFSKLHVLFLRKRFLKKSLECGFSIPTNVCGKGLCILHTGTIVISRHSKIGKNCIINAGVNIGVSPNKGGAPIIGDNVYIGPGAKIFGNITIGNNVQIGANAVVCKSCDDNVVLTGVPAKPRERSKHQ